jgi:hypothetical protein
MKTVEQSVSNTIRGALIAFLENKKDINWLLGTIKSTDIRGDKLKEIFQSRDNYGDQQRYKEAFNKCQEEGLFTQK